MAINKTGKHYTKVMEQRILYITPSRIGDVVLANGLLNYLLAQYPDATVTVVTPALTAPLFSDLPNFETNIIWEKSTYKKHWLYLWQKVRKNHWDVIVDLRGSIVSYLLPASKRIVWRKKKSFANLHKVQQISALITDKLSNASDLLPPCLWLGNENLIKVKNLIGDGMVISLAPIANWCGKQWAIENFLQLSERILSNFPNIKIAVITAPNEQNQAQLLFDKLPKNRVINCTDDASLLLKAGIIKQSKLFIGNDSGLMHISAAVGTNTIGLFGPTNECEYGPWGGNSQHQVIAIRGEKSYLDTTQDKNFDPFTRTQSYMHDLSLEKVWQKTMLLLPTH